MHATPRCSSGQAGECGQQGSSQHWPPRPHQIPHHPHTLEVESLTDMGEQQCSLGVDSEGLAERALQYDLFLPSVGWEPAGNNVLEARLELKGVLGRRDEGDHLEDQLDLLLPVSNLKLGPLQDLQEGEGISQETVKPGVAESEVNGGDGVQYSVATQAKSKWVLTEMCQV